MVPDNIRHTQKTVFTFDSLNDLCKTLGASLLLLCIGDLAVIVNLAIGRELRGEAVVIEDAVSGIRDAELLDGRKVKSVVLDVLCVCGMCEPVLVWAEKFAEDRLHAEGIKRKLFVLSAVRIVLAVLLQWQTRDLELWQDNDRKGSETLDLV